MCGGVDCRSARDLRGCADGRISLWRRNGARGERCAAHGGDWRAPPGERAGRSGSADGAAQESAAAPGRGSAGGAGQAGRASGCAQGHKDSTERYVRCGWRRGDGTRMPGYVCAVGRAPGCAPAQVGAGRSIVSRARAPDLQRDCPPAERTPHRPRALHRQRGRPASRRVGQVGDLGRCERAFQAHL